MPYTNSTFAMVNGKNVHLKSAYLSQGGMWAEPDASGNWLANKAVQVSINMENTWRFDKLDEEHLKMWSKRSFEKFEGNNLAPPGMPSLPSEANEEKEGEAVKRARLEGSKNVRPSCHCA